MKKRIRTDCKNCEHFKSCETAQYADKHKKQLKIHHCKDFRLKGGENEKENVGCKS